MKELFRYSARELARLVRTREISAREVCQSCLDRIGETEPSLHAFLFTDAESLLAQADAVDGQLEKGNQLGPLAGIPVAIKDVIVTRNTPTTCGSRILENYRPPYDATVVERLRGSGAIILGKTNCDEFAMGSSTENSAYQVTANPWDLSRVPGGSSGGSAASVAALQAPVSLGTDTGGSIRQPAAFCGVVGVKPTYGRVPRYGLVAFCSSMDQIGPFARTVSDAADLLQIISGPDPRDSTCAGREVPDFCSEIGQSVQGLRVGVVEDWLGAGLEPEIRDAIRRAASRLEKLGCGIESVHLPHSEHAVATYYVLAPAEASSNLARYDGVRYGFRAHPHDDLAEMYVKTRSQGFGREVKRRIMLGTYVLSAGYWDQYYMKAARVRRMIRKDFIDVFQKVDLLIGPTTPTPAFRIGEKTDDPLAMYLSDIYTVTANLAGVPAMSLPVDFSSDGLPIGLQLIAPHFEEARLLRAAHALEQDIKLKSSALAV